MKYYKIEVSCEPSIIGVNDASAQVEILTKPAKHSFINENERQYYNDFVDKNEKELNRAYMDNFAIIEPSKISIIYAFKTKKRVKEVDIMRYRVYVRGLDFVISKKLLDLIEKNKLSNYNRIKVKVEDFDTEYYLVGFPIISPKKFDFEKSTFYDDFRSKKKVFRNYEEYNNYDGFLDPKNIVLTDRLELDILKIPGSVFFSERLLNEIERMDFKALEINKNMTIENKWI